ncbi:MAG TPA: redoxin domain-containing protein [Candidatus Limnocylindria bacterium]|nr:redoxin domain-containing protein [Candidatus Limnocylindria bacterium]
MTTHSAGLRVTEGQPMPSVGLRATDGVLMNLRSFVGKRPSIVVVAGEGPSRDALLVALSEICVRLDIAGVGLLVVSTHSERRQRELIDELKLCFAMLSDERRSAAATLGVADDPVAFAVSADGVILDIVERPEPRGLLARLLESINPPA